MKHKFIYVFVALAFVGVSCRSSSDVKKPKAKQSVVKELKTRKEMVQKQKQEPVKEMLDEPAFSHEIDENAKKQVVQNKEEI